MAGFDDPAGVSFAPDGSYAYVVNQGDQTISIVNTSASATMGTIAGFDAPLGISIALQPTPTWPITATAH